MMVPRAGLVQSLVIKAQREQLNEIGTALGTPVIYLKAAWADPVLYGGRGERVGSDIDILVQPEAFERFAEALAQRGYRRVVPPIQAYRDYFGHKEWPFLPPPGGWLPVDLHRDLTDPIWFELPTAEMVSRARPWPSVDGPILSLTPEDQILYAAIHYANHLYDLDERHLKDMVRMVEAGLVDWEIVRQRTRAGRLGLIVALLVRSMRAQRAPLPDGIVDDLQAHMPLHQRIAPMFVATDPASLQGRFRRGRLRDYLLLRPLLASRATAFPRVLWRYGLPWAGHALTRTLKST